MFAINRQILLFAILLFSSTLFAQTDSVPAVLIAKPKLTLKPTTDFDQRFSAINKEPVSIWGYRIGVFVNDQYKTGIGGYYLVQNLAGVKTDINGNPLNKLKRQVAFGTIYLEPYVFRKPLLEMSLVLEAGYGRATLDSTNIIRNRVLTKELKEDFYPIGFGFSWNLRLPEQTHPKLLTYVGLNLMIGLRSTLTASVLRQNYQAFYWSIGGAVFLDRIYTDLRGKKHQQTKPASLKDAKAAL